MMRHSGDAVVCAVVVAISLLVTGSVVGQGTKEAAPAPTGSSSPQPWTGRTPWGDPDLQGIWNNFPHNATPLQKPTPEELEQRKRRSQSPPGPNLAYDSSVWGEGPRGGAPGVSDTHLIIEPADGRLPPLTPQAQKRAEERAKAESRVTVEAAWERLHVWDRCITRGLPDAMFPRLYNNVYQIFQIPGYVVILYEMIHDARVIPLGGRPHIPQDIRQWMGDARGRWEGDTLVVETTNFIGYEGDLIPHGGGGYGTYRGAGPTLHLVERFKRIDADAIDYQFTLSDPDMYTRPWTARIPLTKKGSPDQIFEYACHEGNYAIPHTLTGALADEQAARKAATGKR
jgi:hypothetical protein